MEETVKEVSRFESKLLAELLSFCQCRSMPISNCAIDISYFQRASQFASPTLCAGERRALGIGPMAGTGFHN